MPPLTPLVGAQTLAPNNQKYNVPEKEYSAAQQKYIMFRRQRMIAARDARDTLHHEWDDLGFVEHYELQLKADNQYVAPRKNATDTSINTGTIRDKDSTLVQYAMKYDFEPVAQCYGDDDEMMDEIAETGEDMLRKSFMLEQYRDKAKLIYRSMVTFGTALVEDAWFEHWVTEKRIGNSRSTLGSIKQEWVEEKKKIKDGCLAKLWDLRKCYFGDIRKFFMNGPQGQPFFFTVEYESYDMTKQIFGEWDNWKYVPTSVVLTPETSANAIYSSYWTLRPISLNYCEIIRYYDPVANEYAITINGVDMLPIQEKKIKEQGIEKTLISGYPLTEISPSGLIPFAKFDLEPMHDFAYSKSQPSKMRVLGDIENMFFKLMLQMMKQKAKPTMGNKSGRQFGNEVTDPGQIINDVRDGDLFPVLPNYTGATAGDFSFYNMIKKELSKNSVQDSFQGIDNQGSEMTATQDLNNMKSGSLDVASMFDGIISGNQQLYWLRTYNIAKNWTKPIDIEIDTYKKSIENKYRTVNIPTSGENGGKASKKVVFTKNTTPPRPKGKATLEDSMKVHQEEIDAKNRGEGEISLVYLHPEQYRDMKLNWYYSCIPVLTETDPLSYVIFAKQIGDAMAVFGPESMNVKKLKRKFAKATGEDFDTWFLNEQELQQKQQEQIQQAGGEAPMIDTKMAHGAMPGANPSIAKIAGGAKPQVGAQLR